MRLLFIIFVLAFINSQSKQSFENISIYFENNSDLEKSIFIDTYINEKFYRTVSVRNLDNVYDTSLQIHFDKSKLKYLHFMFIVPSSNDTAKCVISVQEINKINHVHVNLVKAVFQKGFDYAGRVLTKDSVVHKIFYSEVLY
jgi:hypothetical protein